MPLFWGRCDVYALLESIHSRLDTLDAGVAGTKLDAIVDKIEQLQEHIVSAFSEALEAWKSYTSELKSQRDAAVAALEGAQQSAQANADALAAFQADDAATDAQQLVDAEQALADQLTTALAEVQSPPAEPEPLPEPEPAPE